MVEKAVVRAEVAEQLHRKSSILEKNEAVNVAERVFVLLEEFGFESELDAIGESDSTLEKRFASRLSLTLRG